MKKNLLKLLLLICCFTLIFGLWSCETPSDEPGTDIPGTDEPGTDEPGTDEPGTDKPGTDEPGTDVPAGPGLQLFNEDGTFRYTVVRPDRNDANVNKAAAQLRVSIQEILNTSVNITDDWLDRNVVTEEQVAAQYEILIGRTNRPESQQVMDTIGEYSYKIVVVGNKIVLAGDTEKSLLMAIQVFVDTYLQDTTMITETLDYTGVFVPHPIDIVLKDKSNGSSNPRLVETKYPTTDVVIADIIVTEDGYAVSNNGMGDSTAGIQKALNDCARNGGGTVYLPAGHYAISGQIIIPPYVTLRGDWQDPDAGTEYGTVICIYGESNDKYAPEKEVIEGTFMLGGSGGVVGLTVYYPEQSLDNIRYYPFTFYTDGNGNNYMLSTVKNVTVINGFRGIGACCNSSGGAHEQLTVENFKGTFLYTGAEVYNQADVGTWQDVVISNKYWKEAAGEKIEAADAEKLDTYTKTYAVGLKLGDLEWTEFESLKVSDCSIGIELMVGKRIQFAGSLMDIEILNCGKGMLIHQLDRRWGMVIARSTIENGIYNYSFQNNANQEPGMVKLCDVKVTGEIKGEYMMDDSDLSSFVVDYKRTYVKPLAILYVANLDKTGATDVSDALQALLNEAAATGGVVYLPGGYYRLDKPIDVPAGVELRGSSSVATREQGWKCNGTVIMSYYGDDASSKIDDRALITLAGDYAGLNGIRIIYPENGPYDENLNTTYAVRGQGKGVYMVNAMISAAAYGVDFRNCDEHFIQKVTTCCYYNTFILGGKNGMLNGCLQNGTVLARSSANLLQNWLAEGNVFVDLFDPITRPHNEYIILEGAEDQQVYNTFAYGVANMIVCRNSTALVANIGSDNLGTGMYQIVVNGGKLVTINSMRWNGKSYLHNSGTLEMYNRLTINIKTEATYKETR